MREEREILYTPSLVVNPRDLKHRQKKVSNNSVLNLEFNARKLGRRSPDPQPNVRLQGPDAFDVRNVNRPSRDLQEGTDGVQDDVQLGQSQGRTFLRGLDNCLQGRYTGKEFLLEAHLHCLDAGRTCRALSRKFEVDNRIVEIDSGDEDVATVGDEDGTERVEDVLHCGESQWEGGLIEERGGGGRGRGRGGGGGGGRGRGRGGDGTRDTTATDAGRRGGGRSVDSSRSRSTQRVEGRNEDGLL